MSAILPPDDVVIPGLYWSVRGEIACVDHAPTVDGVRWIAEGWSAVTALIDAAVTYRCQHCPPARVERDGPRT